MKVAAGCSVLSGCSPLRYPTRRRTVDSFTQRLKAPKGSFYYLFASRDSLLGELWLATFLAAALHTPAWARLHLDNASLLLLYSATISCRAIGLRHSSAACTIKRSASRHAWKLCTKCLRSGRPRRNPARHLRPCRSSDCRR
jgi:AcrR family transcriptional regulator